MNKIFTFLFLLILLLNLSNNIVYSKEKGEAEVKDTTAQSGQQQGTNTTAKDNKFLREKHPCELDENRKASSTGLTGVLQYDIDCVPFHQNEILDLTGKSSYSIVGWIPRIITVVYRFMFTIAVIAFLIASFKYYKAAVTGKGGFGVGFQEAKVALTSSLVGFLIASSAWVIVSMWTRGVSLIEV